MRIYTPALLLLLFARSASAAPPSAADTLIEQGVALRTKRQLTEALDLFRQAHALAPSAKTLAQMGLTEANLKRWVDAETHLDAALNAHDTPWIEAAKN